MKNKTDTEIEVVENNTNETPEDCVLEYNDSILSKFAWVPLVATGLTALGLAIKKKHDEKTVEEPVEKRAKLTWKQKKADYKEIRRMHKNGETFVNETAENTDSEKVEPTE